MAIAKIIEISADSPVGFQDAIEAGLRRSEETLQNVKGVQPTARQNMPPGQRPRPESCRPRALAHWVCQRTDAGSARA